MFSTKVNLLYLLGSKAQRCCVLHLIKQNCLLKKLSKNFNLDDSLPAFPSRTNLQLHNISVTLMMVKKVITNLDSSKKSGNDCISIGVLKNWEPNLSQIPAEIFNICLECVFYFYFPDCWNVSSVVSVIKNVGKRSTAKKTTALLVLF